MCQMLCAHHIWGKGAGRVDIPCNLIALGMDAVRDCNCHSMHHSGEVPTRDCFLAVSAMDHKCMQDDITALVMLIRRLDRDTTREQLFAAIERECGLGARELARRCL